MATAMIGLCLLAPAAAAAAPTITERSLPSSNTGPWGIVTGPDGKLWFTEQNADAVANMTTGGAVTEYTGMNPGSSPAGIAVGPDGNLWLTESGGLGAIDKLTTGGALTSYTFGLTQSTVDGITRGPDGNMWFTEEGGSGAVGKVDLNGNITEYTNMNGLTPFSGPSEIVAGADGNLWFTEYNNPGAIGKITTSGTITEYTSGITGNVNPLGIARGPDGNIWFTEYGGSGAIGKITPAGTVTQYSSGLTSGNEPGGITAGSDGKLWFTEAGTTPKIGSITTSGTITEYTPNLSAGARPARITTGPDGNMWFTENGNPGRIGEITTVPDVSTQGASAITYQAATLSGSVTANAQATTYSFDYGTSTAYGTSTSSASAGSGTTAQPVSAQVTGLSANTTYHYRVDATNGTGTTYGGDQTFTTPPPPPTSSSSAATSVGQTTATVNGTVNPNGLATTYHFDWGTSNTYGSQTPSPEASVGNDSTVHSLTQPLTGLTPATTYHYRIDATSSSGTTYGSDQTFTTQAAPPSETTGAATAVGQTVATLNGSVNPDGYQTTFHIEWGTTTAYGSQLPASDAAVASDALSHPVSEQATGLAPATTYHYRVVATNTSGTTQGPDQTFATLPLIPVVTTNPATTTTPTSATVSGTVNPGGGPTTYHFDWGGSATYGNVTPGADAAAGSDSTAHTVTQTITGLAPGTTYHYRLVATNAAGASYTTNRVFTTPPAPPAATTEPATAVSSDGATLNGTVDQDGGATTYRFEWGTTTAYESHSDDAAANGPVQQTVSGLAAATTYHYRLVATNAAGTTFGGDRTLTTGAAQPPGGQPPAVLPTASAPVAGRTVTVGAASGAVRVKLPGSAGFVPLGSAATIPTGSVIDASHGVVALTSVRDPGVLQTGDFWGASFKIGQIAGAHPVTDIYLPPPSGCRVRTRAALFAARASRPVSLWGRDHGGRFATHGRSAVATVRGTKWLTTDSCQGTVVKVSEGKVAVRDLVRHRTVLVTAGHSYTARVKR